MGDLLNGLTRFGVFIGKWLLNVVTFIMAMIIGTTVLFGSLQLSPIILVWCIVEGTKELFYGNWRGSLKNYGFLLICIILWIGTFIGGHLIYTVVYSSSPKPDNGVSSLLLSLLILGSWCGITALIAEWKNFNPNDFVDDVFDMIENRVTLLIKR